MNFFKWLTLKLNIVALEMRKAELELQVVKLDAKVEARNLLATEWGMIHTDHKEIITALLDAIKHKA